eukprot:3249865-Rhodomonas_salina.1
MKATAAQEQMTAMTMTAQGGSPPPPPRESFDAVVAGCGLFVGAVGCMLLVGVVAGWTFEEQLSDIPHSTASVQVTPLSVDAHPALQLQVKLPSPSVHVAFEEQLSDTPHSTISVQVTPLSVDAHPSLQLQLKLPGMLWQVAFACSVSFLKSVYRAQQQ